MKSIFIISLLTFVYLEVTGHSKQLIFKSDICGSPYSCADCHTARICRSNAEGAFEHLGDINCSPQRPYCDSNTGTCVSQRPTNCASAAARNIHFNEICNQIFSCVNCSTAKVCKPTSNGFIHVMDLPCTDENPYCNPKTGTCGTEQSFGCGVKSDFVCIHDGKFPDSDCDKYEICTNLTSLAFSCVKPNQHYNPMTGKCTDTVPCESFTCLDNFGMKVPHPLNPRFFAFCGENEPIVIDSCPKPYELNFTSQLCEATCHYNGLIEDLDDCHFYYKCTKVYLTDSMTYFMKERKECPEGQAFDPTQYLCVSNITNVPSCNV